MRFLCALLGLIAVLSGCSTRHAAAPVSAHESSATGAQARCLSVSRRGKTWSTWLAELYVVRDDEYGTRAQFAAPASSEILTLLANASGAPRDSQWLSLLADANGMTETWPGQGGEREQITHLILSAQETMTQALGSPENHGWPAIAIGVDGIEFVLQPSTAGERVFVWRPMEGELEPLGENLEDVLQRWICGGLAV